MLPPVATPPKIDGGQSDHIFAQCKAEGITLACHICPSPRLPGFALIRLFDGQHPNAGRFQLLNLCCRVVACGTTGCSLPASQRLFFWEDLVIGLGLRKVQVSCTRSRTVFLALAVWAASGGISVADETILERGPLTETVQPAAPELFAIQFVTPEQQQFRLGVEAGALAYVRNVDTGDELALSISHASHPLADISPGEVLHTERKPARRFRLGIYRILALKEGAVLQEIGSIADFAAGQEYVEPVSGFVFQLLLSPDLKLPATSSGASSSILGCCVDCGAYISCASLVQACGRTCMNSYFQNSTNFDGAARGCPDAN